MKQPVIAIIPARGGSTRVPRKNAKDFCGLPLLAWTIAAAVNSHKVDYVILTTDDDELEAIGNEYGVDLVIRRPHWPDADQASANRPMLHAVDTLYDHFGDLDWSMVTLLPTSPMRMPGDIDKAVKMYQTVGHQVIGMTGKRETFVFKRCAADQCEAVITDKMGKHLDVASGIATVNAASWYKWFIPQIGTDLDSELNEMMQKPLEYPNPRWYYVEYEPWQVFEPDVPDEFELCELVMQHFVLQGRGIEIYEEYGNERWH
jgi:CMP-N-acetylneuraminic acid synthetase